MSAGRRKVHHIKLTEDPGQDRPQNRAIARPGKVTASTEPNPMPDRVTTSRVCVVFWERNKMEEELVFKLAKLH